MLNLARANSLDSTAIEMLERLSTELQRRGIALEITGINGDLGRAFRGSKLRPAPALPA